MKRVHLILFQLILGISIFGQTTLFSEGFESGQGSWLFNPGSANAYRITAGAGYNSNNAVRSNAIGNPDYIISPSIRTTTVMPHRIKFWAKSNMTNKRSMEVYYNTVNRFDGNEKLLAATPYFPTSYKQYSIDWVDPAIGTYYILFKGIGTGYGYLYFDNVEVMTWPNYRPTISFISPLNNDTHIAGTSLPVSITAADADGTVAKVSLYYRGELLDSKTVTPYNFSVPNLPIGNSDLYAIVYDNFGDSTITQSVRVTGINTPPLCTLQTPETDISINQGDSVDFAATASDVDGTVMEVSFFVKGTKVHTDTEAPYTFKWASSDPGTYPVFAFATDNTGLNSYTDTIEVHSTATSTGYLIIENWENSDDAWNHTSVSANDWQLKSQTGMNGTDCLVRNASGVNYMTYKKPIFFSSGDYTVNVFAKSSVANKYNLRSALINGTDTIWSNQTVGVGTTWTKFVMTVNCPRADDYRFMVRAEYTGKFSAGLNVDDISVYGSGGKPNIPPIVKILTPAKGIEVALNTVINLTSLAYDVDGSIAKVEYFANDIKIGEATTGNFPANWTPTASGVYTLKVIASDNLGKTSQKVTPLFVSYADRKVYDISASSFLGAEAGSGRVWGTIIQSDGTIVLACEWGNVIPDGVVLHLLNGTTTTSRGAVVRLSSDGKKILSITKIGDYAVDISMDESDNIYIAAANKGLVKLNKLADKMLLNRTFSKNVYRIDAGKTGYTVVLTRPLFDFDGKMWNNVTCIILNPAGDVLTTFGGASNYTNDVCIDEKTQTAVEVGWKNIYASALPDLTDYLPVDIPGIKAYSFSGNLKYVGYNWNGDITSPNWVNKSENNMADSRLARCSMGQDGLLYVAGECSGGNHQFRYSPYDIMTKVRIVGGDNFHNMYNTNTEFHTFIGRMNVATGQYIEGQTFTSRLPDGAGNTLTMENGNVTADKDGRLYFTGSSAYGMPITSDSLPQVAYTGGAFIYIMNPTLEYREQVNRVIVNGNGIGVAVRKFDTGEMSVVYGGFANITTGKEIHTTLFAKSPFQSEFYGTQGQMAGFFALIGGAIPKKYAVTADAYLLGLYPEGEKLNLNTTATNSNGQIFSHWSGGGDYINDSTKIDAVLSVPGRDMVLTPIFRTIDAVSELDQVSFKCYPNPTKDYIKVETGTQITLPISVCDLTGKVLYSDQISANKTMSTGFLNKGVYILVVGKNKQKLIVL